MPYVQNKPFSPTTRMGPSPCLAPSALDDSAFAFSLHPEISSNSCADPNTRGAPYVLPAHKAKKPKETIERHAVELRVKIKSTTSTQS